MRLAARTRANQINAKRSTGPRTAVGKAQVARNALKHGLAIPVRLAAGADGRIEEMARLIAADAADAVRLELSRRIAEAQLDLLRIREARRMLLGNPEAQKKRPNLLGVGQVVASASSPAAEKVDADDDEAARGLIEALRSAHPPNLEEGFDSLAPRLASLDRYERRAISRRKSAIRAFDAYCAERRLESDVAN
jgi:hypothetical protein